MDRMLTDLDAAFANLDRHSRELLARLEQEELFLRPDGSFASMTPLSCGEYLLRSAGAVEQTFQGITTRLWDDPFEWTLPEKLATKALVLQYLDEVEATRKKAFGFFRSDEDLRREIPAPETTRSLGKILLDTLSRASHLQGRAFALYQVTTAHKPPPI